MPVDILADDSAPQLDANRRRYFTSVDHDDDPQPFKLLKQELNLEVNFREKKVVGESILHLILLKPRVDEISIDARQCEIDLKNITVVTERGGANPEVSNRKKVNAIYEDLYTSLVPPRSWQVTAAHHDIRRLRMRNLMRTRVKDLAADMRDTHGCTPVDGSLKIKLRPKDDERRKLKIRKSTGGLETPDLGASSSQDWLSVVYTISIPFKMDNFRDGLHFVGVDVGDIRFPHVYTRHTAEAGTASCIFPCVDDYGCRCDWRVNLKFPVTLGDALMQALVTQQKPVHSHSQGRDASSTERQYSLEEKDKLLEMTAICSGILAGDSQDPDDSTKRIMTFDSQKPTSAQQIGFVIGPFEHVDLWSEFRTEEDDEKLGASALKIHGYCLPGRADQVRNSCAAIASAADFFTLTFSRNPFDSFKLCFVDDLVDDTFPVHSLAFAANRLLFPEDVIDNEVEVTRSLVHSLASQWSGSSMVANTRQDLWLIVGIAYYMTDLFMRRLCGNNEYRFRIKSMCDKLVQLDVGRPSLHELGKYLHLGDFEMEFLALKAPLVLFILDKRLVKASGSSGLTKIVAKLFLKANTGSSETDSVLATDAFIKICEKNGKYKLESFWAQWVHGSGCPRFKVTQRFNKKRLCVEMTLRQVQGDEPSPAAIRIEKTDFLRRLKELLHGLNSSSEGPRLFTGPMTIRIHEADGTPYEHIVEIREDGSKVTKFEIPYNTKYKRLKRTRRQKERQNAAAGADMHGDHQEDALLYCLGDVLQSPEDMASWELHDWDADVERKMDQESYEWIRMDTDFEWICEMQTNLESYMYVSQLQQDRDVVAQQDSMVYLNSSPSHPLVSTILTRTLVDRRYFHGIRTMAAEILPKHANIEGITLLGLRHLVRAYAEMFCYPGTHKPRPNDFSDKKQYAVQSATLHAISRVRDLDGRCPVEGQRFLLDQLIFNNNDENVYSDHHHVATLIKALATSLIPDADQAKKANSFKVPPHNGADGLIRMETGFNLGDEGEDEDEEMGFETSRGPPQNSELLELALEVIDRYRRRDEWELSYQNIWTVAALDAKQRLMKAGVMPTDGLDFAQYLQDETHELVRIKAFEALIDLGLFLQPAVFRLTICTIAADRSPFVRRCVLKALGRGLAALALGEHSVSMSTSATATTSDELIVQDSDLTVNARKAQVARTANLTDALAALKTDVAEQFTAEGPEYQRALEWALNSAVLGRDEMQTLLEICSVLFKEADEFIVKFRLPKKWKFIRFPENGRIGRRLVKFKSSYWMPTGRPKDSEPTTELMPLPLPLPPPTDIKADAPQPPAPTIQKRPSIILKGAGSKLQELKASNSTPRASIAPTSPTTVLSGQDNPPSAAPSSMTQVTPLSVSTAAASPMPTGDTINAHPKAPGDKDRMAIKTVEGPVKTPKRPRPEKGTDADGVSPASKKRKAGANNIGSANASTNASGGLNSKAKNGISKPNANAATASERGSPAPTGKKSRLVTLKHKNLHQILNSSKGVRKDKTPSSSSRAGTPVANPALTTVSTVSTLSTLSTVSPVPSVPSQPKPGRKPLPSSAPASHHGSKSAASTTASKTLSIATKATSSSSSKKKTAGGAGVGGSVKSGSATPAVPQAAPIKKVIKIVRKSSAATASSPPPPS